MTTSSPKSALKVSYVASRSESGPRIRYPALPPLAIEALNPLAASDATLALCSSLESTTMVSKCLSLGDSGSSLLNTTVFAPKFLIGCSIISGVADMYTNLPRPKSSIASIILILLSLREKYALAINLLASCSLKSFDGSAICCFAI